MKKFLLLVLVFLLSCTSPLTNQRKISSIVTNGAISNLWDIAVSPFITNNLINERLLSQGDVYALYDLEIFLHPYLVNIEHHQESEKIVQLLEIISKTQSALQTSNGNQIFICKGGAICKGNNFIGSEVFLPSVQYIGFVSHLIRAYVNIPNAYKSTRLDNLAKKIAQNALSSHLLRWINQSESSVNLLSKKLVFNYPEDAKKLKGVSDKDLWMLSIVSDLSAIALDYPSILYMADSEKKLIADYYFLLTSVLKNHIQFKKQDGFTLANFDLGAWDFYSDFSLSQYSGTTPPATCNNGKIKFNIDINTVPQPYMVGWDVSHARRFVYAFESAATNEAMVEKLLNVKSALNFRELNKALANNFYKKSMGINDNGEVFVRNFMDGSNGYYRAAYSNGTGACYTGEQPSSALRWALTGGFPFWGKYNSGICSIFLKTTTHDQFQPYAKLANTNEVFMALNSMAMCY